MAPFTNINLLAGAALAILALVRAPEHANALSLHSTNHFARHHPHIPAIKKRSSARCKQRPATTTSSDSQAAPASTDPAPSSTDTPTTQDTPTSSSAVAQSSPTTQASSSSGNGKVGLAWPNGDDQSLWNFKSSKVSMLYTWSPTKPAVVDQVGLEFIPMLWGDSQIDEFASTVKAGYASKVLGFNEPDQVGQALMTPQHAADVWTQYIQPLKSQGYQLITPAVTSAPEGKVWMQDFFSACKGCTFDGLALHWYGTDPQAFISYMNDFHTTFNLPIWPTEFACQSFTSDPQCTQDEVFSFMDTVTTFMDNTDWVVAYFAFGVMHDMQGVNVDNQLMAANGQPTDLGRDYLQ